MKKLFGILLLSFVAITAQAEDEASSSRVAVSRGKYITGGILGSVIGFGIGHGIQGRYAELGWVFTAGEVAGFAAMTAGLSSCSEVDKGFGVKKTECSNTGLITLGLATAIGFHVWEIVDVWTGARGVDEETLSPYFLPDPKAPSVGVAYRF